MTELEQAVNIGPSLAGELRAVGIPDVETLRQVGPEQAARRMEAAGGHDCTNSYLALVGALAGVRWMSLPRQQRVELAASWRARRAVDDQVDPAVHESPPG